MTNAVQAIAVLNGYASSNAAASLVSSPTGDGHQAVEVTVTTDGPLVLTRLLGTASQLPGQRHRLRRGLEPNGSACILALKSGGTGITLSGGTSVTASSCMVASDSTSASTAGVQAPCGTSITANTVYYDSTPVPSQPCNGIKTSSGSAATLSKAVTPDPLASNAEVTTAATHLTTVVSMTSPTVTTPTVPAGTNVSFPWYQAPTQPLPMPTGCTLSGYTSGPWTVTCTGAGPFNFGNVVVPSGMAAATFVNTTAATFNFVSISGPVTFTTTVSNTLHTISSGISASGTSSYAWPAPTTSAAASPPAAAASPASAPAPTRSPAARPVAATTPSATPARR